MTTPPHIESSATMRFLSVLLPSHEATVAAYKEAASLRLPGCCYAFPAEDGGVLTSVTSSDDTYIACAISAPFAKGEVVLLGDEAAHGVAQVAEAGLSRNFIEDGTIQVVCLDGSITVGAELQRHEVVRRGGAS